MATHESTKVQLVHLNEAILALTGKVDRLLDLTQTIAILKVEADNHREQTQQMEVRIMQTTAKLEAGLDAEEASRIHANKNIHGRIDVVRRWMFSVGGGGIVVLALLGYVGESIKSFAGAYMEAHDAAIRQEHELETLRSQVVELYRSKGVQP